MDNPVVVDDVEVSVDDSGPSNSVLNGHPSIVRTTSPESFQPPPATTATRPRRTSMPSARLRSSQSGFESSDRTTRSATQRSRQQPKLKLKLSEKAAAQAPGMSFLGPYDRELDSDGDEDLAFEEQFILRLPPGEDCERLKKMVGNREISNDVWFKFKGKFSKLSIMYAT
jgi:transcription initiation factor TFIID subunit 7